MQEGQKLEDFGRISVKLLIMVVGLTGLHKVFMSSLREGHPKW